VPRSAIAPLGLTTEGSTKFKLKGWKCYLKKLQWSLICNWYSLNEPHRHCTVFRALWVAMLLSQAAFELIEVIDLDYRLHLLLDLQLHSNLSNKRFARVSIVDVPYKSNPSSISRQTVFLLPLSVGHNQQASGNRFLFFFAARANRKSIFRVTLPAETHCCSSYIYSRSRQSISRMETCDLLANLKLQIEKVIWFISLHVNWSLCFDFWC